MRLVEDYRDDALQILNKLHTETKELLVGDPNANFTDSGFDKSLVFPIRGRVEYNWGRAWEQAGDKDKELLAKAFIMDQEGTWGYKLTLLNDVILHIMNDLGLKQSDNPFFKLIGDLHNKGIDITREDLIMLNNLYSTGELSYEDVKDNDSLLYNTEFWNKLDFKERQKVLKYYLYVEDHPGTYKEEPFDKGAYASTDAYIRDRLATTDKDTPGHGIFVKGSNPSSTATLQEPDASTRFVEIHYLRNSRDLPSLLNSGSKTNTSTTSSPTPTRVKSEADKLINTSKLTYKDFKDMMNYIELLHSTGRLR